MSALSPVSFATGSRTTMIRLLNVNTYQLQQFRDYPDPNMPPYIIASHRWSENEPTYSSLMSALSSSARYPNALASQSGLLGRSGPTSASDSADHMTSPAQNIHVHKKIHGFCNAIKTHREDIEWLWIDSVCINRDDANELEHAINSMFQWYRNADCCFVHLWDTHNRSEMEKSDWFSRGWTLQELIATDVVAFFSQDWKVLGHKCPSYLVEHQHAKYGPRRNRQLSRITEIRGPVLRDFDSIGDLTVGEVLTWMARRETTKAEDKVYSLIGIFGTFIPLQYGEGADRAGERLFTAIYRQTYPDRGASKIAQGIKDPSSILLTSRKFPSQGFHQNRWHWRLYSNLKEEEDESEEEEDKHSDKKNEDDNEVEET